ncbi:MAG: hypothetical protein L0Y72_08860 [Gemmataceae bacterium]|nr:hypothetical protein [Gemmataceae bacterium]MCI0739140.1 hypothetical protein [Gemmataceae bacterium]
MATQLNLKIQRKWHELLARAEAPEWIREMIRHYRKTRKFRPQDLRRLLGNPNVGVEFGPNSSLADAIAQLAKGE